MAQRPSQDVLWTKFQMTSFAAKLRHYIDRATSETGVMGQIRSTKSRALAEECDKRYPDVKCPPRWAWIPYDCEDEWVDEKAFLHSLDRMNKLVVALSTIDCFSSGSSVGPNKLCDEVERFLSTLGVSVPMADVEEKRPATVEEFTRKHMARTPWGDDPEVNMEVADAALEVPDAEPVVMESQSTCAAL